MANKVAKDIASKLAADLQKKFGKDTAMVASEIPRYPAISSGSLALDFAIGIGGLPSDRVIELAGKEKTGKTTLALLAMQQFLAAQPDRGALILDLEHKLDPAWLEFLVGKDLLQDRVIYCQPDHIEEATNIYRQAVSTGQICFVLLDSIGGAPTRRTNEDAEVGSYGGNSLGVKEFANVAKTLSAKKRCLTIGVNQIREDMSGYHQHKVPGGHAWLHAVALRLLLKRGKGKITDKVDGDEYPIGYEIACKVYNSQVGIEGRTAFWWFMNCPTEKYGFGVDRIEEITRLALLTDVIERKGGWYHHAGLPGEGKILGRDQLMDEIRKSETLRTTLSRQVIDKLAEHGSEVAPMSDPEEPIADHFPNLLQQDEFDD